ncbi:MAG: hypothetical protein KGZ41_04440 [Dethiobacter sp.]|nr:hypothetical protein [Dethiobacter sp.]MBS3983028.1 hypothetical protein [Dethiobacter sp.]MCL4462493.1 hypothetical protein [Bacillota bacterium]MCL5993734.1 hypothetical protein [Bacillota bacterium]
MYPDQSFPNQIHDKEQAFLIRIKFRRHNCWQGSIQWLEGQKILSFRSLLEMILLMHEALDKNEKAVDEQIFRSWTDG